MGVQLHEDRYGLIRASVTIGALTANDAVEVDLTVPGVRVNDFVAVAATSFTNDVVIGQARVSAADTVKVTVGNVGAGTPTPGAYTFLVFYFRAENITNNVAL